MIRPTPTFIASIKETRDRVDLDFLREEIPAATEQSLFGMEQVSRIVLAMKEFSHPSSQEKSPVDLNRAISNTITISRNEWKHFANVETHLDRNLPMVTCHAGEINQVLLNVIVNAAQAIGAAGRSNADGVISISTARDGEDVVIRVRDNGTGIPTAVQEKVFNPFFTTKAVGKGTGQGLAIARDIVVNKHGGTITFNTHEGKGTVFIVRLPVSQGTAGSIPLMPTSEPDSAKMDDAVDKL